VRLHVVALAAYQLEGRGVDLEKNTVDTRWPYGGLGWVRKTLQRSMRGKKDTNSTHLITLSLSKNWAPHSYALEF
jgi:hypothetical protein